VVVVVGVLIIWAKGREMGDAGIWIFFPSLGRWMGIIQCSSFVLGGLLD
jgi:hypothetical protein